MGLSTWIRRWFSGAKVEGRRPFKRPRLEALEDRAVPATFTVTNAADHGAGSLRTALAAANSAPGSDTIDFAVGTPGTAVQINLRSALPAIRGPVLIDGAS